MKPSAVDVRLAFPIDAQYGDAEQGFASSCSAAYYARRQLKEYVLLPVFSGEPMFSPFVDSALRLRWFVALALIARASAGAQSATVNVSDKLTCPECRIELSPVVKLGGSTEAEGLIAGRGSMVSRDSEGRFFVTLSVNPYEFLVFDKTGRFLRAVGRKGTGPGEFGEIRRVWVGPGDSLHVFDFTRYTVLTPNFAYVRAVPIADLSWDAIFSPSGSVVRQTDSGIPGRVGYPLHLISADGTIRRTFGTEKPVRIPRNGYGDHRAIAASRSGGYWSALHTEYRIDRWDTLGTRLQTIRRDARWFKPWTGTNVLGPRIFAIREDEQRRLWVVIQTTEPVRTVVEVIDLQAGALITRAEFSYTFVRFAGDLIWRSAENAAGDPIVDVMQMRLVPAPRR